MAHREVYPVVPPKVEYSLTEMGRAFLPVLEKINAWEERYAEEQSLPCSRQCLCHSAGGSSLGTMDSTNQYFYGVRMFVSLRVVAARRIWHGADKESNLFGSRDAKDDESEVGNAQKKSQTGKVRAVMPFKTREVSQACRNLLVRAMKRLA